MRMIRQDGSYCGSDDHPGMDGHAARQSDRLSMM